MATGGSGALASIVGVAKALRAQVLPKQPGQHDGAPPERSRAGNSAGPCLLVASPVKS